MHPEDTLPIISEMGFSKIEVFVNSNSEFNPSYINEFKKQCDFYGLNVFSVHPFTSFAEPQFFFSGYDRRFDEGLELYKRYYESAVILGAEMFNLHGGLSVQEIPPDSYAEIYQKLFIAAKEQGIKLSQENVARCKCGRLDYLKKVFELLDGEMYITLDIKQAHLLEEEPLDFADSLGEKIVLCHINDYDDGHKCLLPCMGMYDYKKLDLALSSKGFKGNYMIEVYSDNYSDYHEIKKSKELLEKII